MPGAADAPPGSPIDFVVSTTGVQRDGIDLRAGGWYLDRYRANSVVLWCHQHDSEPIGRAPGVGSQEMRLRAPVYFDQEDDRATRVESKVRRGFINATSVGWDFVDERGSALEWWRLNHEDMRDRAFYDLLEISVVPVPADPGALAVRQRAALRSLSRELATMFDDQEHPRSRVTAPELRAAVRAELRRQGIDLAAARTRPATDGADEPTTINGWRARAGLPAVEWGDVPWSPLAKGDIDPGAAGVRVIPDPAPVPPTDGSVARAAVVDQEAARLVLAAFGTDL